VFPLTTTSRFTATRLNRFFTLHGHVLCYYDALSLETVDPSKPRGRLNLSKEDTVAEMQTNHGKGSPTEFLVTVNIYVLGNKRKWEMCALDGETQRRWYDALRRYDGPPALINEIVGEGSSSSNAVSKGMGEKFRTGSPGSAVTAGLTRRRRTKSSEIFKETPDAPTIVRSADGRRTGSDPAKLGEPEPAITGKRTSNEAAAGDDFRDGSSEWDEEDEDAAFPAGGAQLERQPLLDRGVVVSWAALNVAFYFLGTNGARSSEVAEGVAAADRTFWMALFVGNFVVYHLIEHLNQRGEMRILIALGQANGGLVTAVAGPSRNDVGKRTRRSPNASVRQSADSKAKPIRGAVRRRKFQASHRPSAASFVKGIPAGSTISRAPVKPGTPLDAVVTEKGPSSAEAIRAYGGKDGGKGEYGMPMYDESIHHSYWNAVPSGFQLRVGPNYKKAKRKEPSGPALYDLIAMDFVKSDGGAIKNASDGFVLPKISGVTDADTGNSHVPSLFVINAWLPAEEPSMFANPAGVTGDAPTYTIVLYFAATPSTLAQLRDIRGASPAVRLLAEWCRRSEAGDDAFRSRFKAIGFVEDIEQTGLPSFIAGYNGKPALVTKSGTYNRRSLQCVEMTANIHMWGYLARKGLHAIKDKFSKFVVNVGFTIEGRADEELPEILLGGARIMHLDPAKAVDDAGMAGIAAEAKAANAEAKEGRNTPSKVGGMEANNDKEVQEIPLQRVSSSSSV